MRVALVYDRLNKLGGAEAVLVELARLFPSADWYTSVWNPGRAPFSKNWPVHSSWLNRLPFLSNHHEWIPYLMPFVFEAFDLGAYDLVISVGSAEAKGVLTKPGTPHLHYCLTPTRYLYSHQSEYLTNWIYRTVAKPLRYWDQVAATRPDEMIAISTQVKKRIKKYYNRESAVIYPPVNTHKFKPSGSDPAGNYFLVVSRLVRYKKIDVLIRAANRAKVQLTVIGEGNELRRLKKLAGPTVTFLGQVSERALITHYQHCKAFLQANEEDFGIGMCEALASGKPVIAYQAGGAADIVIPGKTGILLSENTVAAFAKVLTEFDTMTFVPSVCVASAKRFDKNIWIKKIKERIDRLCQTRV